MTGRFEGCGRLEANLRQLPIQPINIEQLDHQSHLLYEAARWLRQKLNSTPYGISQIRFCNPPKENPSGSPIIGGFILYSPIHNTIGELKLVETTVITVYENGKMDAGFMGAIDKGLLPLVDEIPDQRIII